MMKCKMDMHLHTYYSDGVLSPSEIVARAKKLGCGVISVTDHDGTDGVREAVAAGLREGITVIPGIEFSVYEDFEGAEIVLHMLGYHIDIDNEALREEIRMIRSWRDKRNAKLIETLRRMGYELDSEKLLAKTGGYIGKPDIARHMAEKGYINAPREAFAKGKCLDLPEIKAIKKQKPDAARAIRAIVNSSGMAVLAHPAKIRRLGERGGVEFYAALERLVCILMGYGLKGIECYHRDHSPEEADKLVEIAEKYNLVITEGSDYHGEM